MTAAVRPQPMMKRLAAGLSFVCLVLFLLAIDQRQTVEAARSLRDLAAPVAGRLWIWAGRMPSDAAHGWTGLRHAWAGQGVARVLVAADGTDLLAGEYAAADPATRETTGGVAFVAARIQFERGGTLRTRPMRIAAGGEAWAAGQTYAARLAAARDAQIELRRVAPLRDGETVAPSPLCAGAVPAVVAVLHRGRQVELMLFRQGPGPEASPDALCGVWRYRGP